MHQLSFFTKGGIVIPNIDFITSLLNITPDDVLKCTVTTSDDTVYYSVTLKRKPMTCPLCGCKMIGHGHKQKSIHHPALRDRKGVILYNANRYICKNCRKTVLERNPFAMSGYNSSYLLMQSAMKHLGNLNYTLNMISEELNISTTQLCKYLDSYVVIPPRKLPESLGIDEIYNKYLSRKNSSYLCILVDNVNRSIFDILDSRSKEHLSLYFSRYPREERLNVRYVTIDMWTAYRDVVHTYLPNAIVAVDPFHVIWHLSKAFDRLRLDIMNQCEYGSNAYYLLKKWNWLLVKDNLILDNERVYNHRFKTKLNHRDIMKMIFDTFPVLSYAYDLKEEYRYFNSSCNYIEACNRFDSIYLKFKNSGIGQFDEFTTILSNWKEEILNSFKRPFDDRKLSNAFSENINHRIRTYLTVSNGVTNFSRFRKRVMYALSPDIFYSLKSTLHSDKRIGKRRGKYNISQNE